MAGLWCARACAQSTATVSWNADSTVAGYRVYLGTESGVYTEMDDVGDTTAASITDLQPGVTYYVTVAAYDSSDNEGPPSSEVTVTPADSGTTTTTGTDSGTTTSGSDGTTTSGSSGALASGTTPAAVFVTSDTATQGNWKGVYGSDGFNTIDDTVQYPAYVTVSNGGAPAYAWENSTTQVRALEKAASSSNRIAACWYSPTGFTIDLDITDGNAHQFALYALDWDSYGGIRSETIQIVDPATGTVLDTESISAFQNGEYLVWTIRGHVQVIVTTNNPNSNSVVSGLFFDPAQSGTAGGSGGTTTSGSNGTTTSGTSTTSGTGTDPMTPVAPNQTVLVLATTPVVIDVLAAAGESGSTVSRVSQPGYGGAAVNGDGTITYTPGIDFVGHDSFKYTVSSGTLSATGTISLTNRGSFNGLVTNATPTADNTGGLQLTLGPGGRFTGRLTSGAVSAPFRGVFNADGQATVTIQPSGQPTITLSLNLDPATGVVSGSMSTGTASSSVSAAIATYSLANKAPQAGSYTVLMPPDPNAAAGTSAPQGIGYFRLVVGTNGIASLTGILADSTVVSVSAPVAADGSLSFYKPLYAKQGYLSGALKFEHITTSGSESDLDGAVQWQRPQKSTSSMYPSGFATGIDAIGSAYVIPSQIQATAAILTAGQKEATVWLAGSDLTAPVEEQVWLVSANLFVEKRSGKNGLTVAINPRTGMFIGSFLDPTTNKVRKLGGALFQKRAIGAGSFYGNSSSGSVMMANGETGNP